jgi:hypothetical protein
MLHFSRLVQQRTTMCYLVTLLVATLLFLCPRPAHAAVVTICDEAGLTAAISTTPANGTVSFTCSGTITLTAATANTGIVIAQNLTFDATGQTVTIDGGSNHRIFYVNTGITLNLNNLTLSHGAVFGGSGGAIYNNGGTLNITNSTFSNNYIRGFQMPPYIYALGAAIYNKGGTLSVTNSSFTSNSSMFGLGAGIYSNGGTGSVTSSTFTSNYGGAIVTVSGSTFTVNSSSFNGNPGWAISNEGTLTVNSSSFNDGAIYNYRATLTVNNSTFSGNSATYGSVIFDQEQSAITITGSILTNSSDAGNCGRNPATPPGTLTDGGYNIEDTNTCNFTQPTSLPNTNPLLGPLADNGGPTQTFALLPGSPALDAIPPANCFVATDQRGLPRPSGAGCDIGAFELQSKISNQASSDLIPQFRISPDREGSTDPTTEITFSFKVKNIGQGTANSLRVELPIDPSLVVGYGSFADPRVWVSAVTSNKVVVSLPPLAYNQEVSGKVVFRPSPSATPGSKISLKYLLRFDDPAGAGKTLLSNGQSFTFAASSRDASGGTVQYLTPDVATANVGDNLVVVGEFFLPDEFVSAWYTDSNGQGVALGMFRADSNGKSSLTLATKNLAAGSYVVVLYGNRSEVTGITILTLQ